MLGHVRKNFELNVMKSVTEFRNVKGWRVCLCVCMSVRVCLCLCLSQTLEVLMSEMQFGQNDTTSWDQEASLSHLINLLAAS